MPRDLPIGNGSMLVAFDADYQIRELYYPHVGEENHTKGRPFRMGVWCDGQFSWIPHGWKLRRDYDDESLITAVTLQNDALQLDLHCNDLVDFHENIYQMRRNAPGFIHGDVRRKSDFNHFGFNRFFYSL